MMLPHVQDTGNSSNTHIDWIKHFHLNRFGRRCHFITYSEQFALTSREICMYMHHNRQMTFLFSFPTYLNPFHSIPIPILPP